MGAGGDPGSRTQHRRTLYHYQLLAMAVPTTPARPVAHPLVGSELGAENIHGAGLAAPALAHSPGGWVSLFLTTSLQAASRSITFRSLCSLHPHVSPYQDTAWLFFLPQLSLGR